MRERVTVLAGALLQCVLTLLGRCSTRPRGCVQTRHCISEYHIKRWVLTRFHPERFCAEDFPCPVEAGSSRSTEPACLHLPLSMEARGGYDQPHVFNACIIGIMNHLVMSVITDLLSIGSKRVNDTCAYSGAWFTEFPGGSPVDHNPITGYQP